MHEKETLRGSVPDVCNDTFPKVLISEYHISTAPMVYAIVCQKREDVIS